MTNLFIYILQDPSSRTAQSDVALMDVGAGYFARLEFATCFQYSITLVKDIAVLARNAVSQCSTQREASSIEKEGQAISSMAIPPLPALESGIISSNAAAKANDDVRQHQLVRFFKIVLMLDGWI